MSNENTLDPADKYVGDMDALLKKAEKRDTRLNIHQRLWMVMQDVWYVQKRDGKGFYNTVEHDDVTRKVRPALIRHGVVAYPTELNPSEVQIIKESKYDPNTDRDEEKIKFFTEARLMVKFVNIDDTDDFILIPTYAHGVDQAGNATGKAISYAIKYAYLKALNLETGDKEDRDHLVNPESDENAVSVYNEIGKELFGDDWDEMSKRKIFVITKGKTSEADRAPTWAINEATKNLWNLKKKKEENPEKDIKEIDKQSKKENPPNDIVKDFQDED